MDAHAAESEELTRTTRAVRRLARELVHDGARADDLTQDAWLAALHARGRIRGPLGPWLLGAVRRLRRRDVRDDARRDGRERRAARPEAQPPVDELVARAELGERLLAAVRALPEPYRETLLLRYLEELEPDAIARRQGASASTVRTRVQRGLALLRARLGARDGELAALMPLLTGLAAPSATSALVPLIVMTNASKLALAAVALALGVLALRAPWSSSREPSGALALAPGLELASASHGDARALPPVVARASRDEPLAPELAAHFAPTHALEHFLVEGVVVDEHGAPIGARLTVSHSSQGSLRASTDPWGEFGFSSLPAGRWTLHASAPGRIDTEHALHLHGTPRVERVELVLLPQPRLAVRVVTPTGEWYAAPPGLPPPSPFAVATTEAPPEFLPSKRVAPSQLGDWKPELGAEGQLGTLAIEAGSDCYVSLVVGQWVIATEPVRAGAESVRFVLDPRRVEASMGSVTARILDSTGAPLPRAHATLALPGNATSRRRVDADGRLTLPRLRPGDYELEVSPGLLTRSFRLAPGEALDLGDLVVGTEAPGSARLRVHVEAPASAGTRLHVSSGRTLADMTSSTPVTGGVAELDGLEPGRYVVGVSSTGRPSDMRARPASVDVRADAIAEVTLRLDPVGWLVLQPDTFAPLGTRYRVIDAGTELVNLSGEITAPQPLRLALPRGAWRLELVTPAGVQLEQPVIVGAEPVTIALPR